MVEVKFVIEIGNAFQVKIMDELSVAGDGYLLFS